MLPVQVSFDELDMNRNKSVGQRKEYWEATKRLQHGTLVALWWADRINGRPCILFAAVEDRDAGKLAPRIPGARPSIGIRCRPNTTLLNDLEILLGLSQCGAAHQRGDLCHACSQKLCCVVVI